jgi:isoleucyl-tRNA synthetase
MLPRRPAAVGSLVRRARTASNSTTGGGATDAKAALKATLNLPQTTLPMRAAPSATEPPLCFHLSRGVYAWQRESRADAPLFVLHDGPPYANGELHMGHLLNKVLKDIVNRHELLRGHRVEFVPGWDCHGLPIELKAAAEAQVGGSDAAAPDDASTDPAAAARARALAVRRAAARLAASQVEVQRASFERWGVMGEWGNPYITMHPAYEAAELRVLACMVSAGLVRRGLRPVHWSPVSQTALAEAELEYRDDHTSVAAWVAFPLSAAPLSSARAGGATQFQSSNLLPPILARLLGHASASAAAHSGAAPAAHGSAVNPAAQDVGIAPLAAEAVIDAHEAPLPVIGADEAPSLVIWTTTPWTIPLNQAVCAGGGIGYALVRPSGGNAAGRLLLVAESRVGELATALGCEMAVVERVQGDALAGSWCVHPLSGRAVPILLADHVSDTAGSGLVHTAPAHGVDDFNVGLAHGLSLDCAVDVAGCFTAAVAEATPYIGKRVLAEGGEAVLADLKSQDALLASAEYTHRYPYDWRSHAPVIFRATAQWFASVDTLRPSALAALDEVRMIPPAGRARLEAFVRGRAEWCLSRQRPWGVPLPAFYHAVTGEPLLTQETVEHVAKVVEKNGADAWWELSTAELLPPRLAHEADLWVRGTDTLDVWFDSGCSWAAMAERREREAQISAGSAAVPLGGAAGGGGATGWDAAAGRAAGYGGAAMAERRERKAHEAGGSGQGAIGGGEATGGVASGAAVEAAGGGGAGPLRGGGVAIARADMYLEGSDQHRGWFQSSLLTKIATGDVTKVATADMTKVAARGTTMGIIGDTAGGIQDTAGGIGDTAGGLIGDTAGGIEDTARGTEDTGGGTVDTARGDTAGATAARPPTAPFACVVTHGFVVDEFGAKMSKSRGNVIRPSQLIGGVAIEHTGAAATPSPVAGAAAGTSEAARAAASTAAAAGSAVGTSGSGGVGKRAKRPKAKGGATDPLNRAYGADVLRLWVAMSDWRGDVAIGPTVLEKTAEVRAFKKILRLLHQDPFSECPGTLSRDLLFPRLPCHVSR